MDVDTEFLRRVQNAGWHIETVTTEAVTAKCPSNGCALRAQLRPELTIPSCDTARDRKERVIGQYDDLRRILRSRREKLGLSIRDIEEIAGATGDHIAKAEKDDPSRIPNGQIMIEWANALGFDVVLRPKAITPYGLRVICETRSKLDARQKRFAVEAARRA